MSEPASWLPGSPLGILAAAALAMGVLYLGRGAAHGGRMPVQGIQRLVGLAGQRQTQGILLPDARRRC